MKACASCACSVVAVLPVPIAHTGSYARTRPSGSATASAIARTWRSRTCSVSPASRSNSVSPTQAIAHRPDSSAALARCAVVSSVSPKYWRRSECPTSDPATPRSRSMGGAISPVKAPSDAQCVFCAQTEMLVPPRMASACTSDVNGGHTATSTSSTVPSAATSSWQNASVSDAVLNIFQLPAMSMSLLLWDREDAGKFLAFEQLERGAAPGRDPGDPVGEAELLDRAYRVAAADDGVGRRVG